MPALAVVLSVCNKGFCRFISIIVLIAVVSVYKLHLLARFLLSPSLDSCDFKGTYLCSIHGVKCFYVISI